MTADEIIDQAKDLPVISETARKLTVQLNQPDSNRDDVIETLRCDNVLTAKVLRACNSAEYGSSEPVVSIDQALLLLGDNVIFRMVCSIGYGSSLGGGPGADTEANGLWSHSLRAAVGAEYLAGVETYGNFEPATAFTAGLLHDIGKSVISKMLTPKNRADIRQKIAQESVSRAEAEKAVLGAHHSEIGACLLRRWALPEPIIEAVTNHHSPIIHPEINLSAVVYLANCAAHIGNIKPEWQNESDQMKAIAAETLEMDVERIDEIIAGIEESMHQLPQLLASA